MGTLSYGYDGGTSTGPGNPTSFKGTANGFNVDNQMTGAGFSYDGNGLRATKTAVPIGGSGPVTTYFLYDGSTPVQEEQVLAQGASFTAVNVEAADGIRARYSQTLNSQFYSFDYDPQGSLVGSQYSGNTTTPAYSTSSFEAYGHRGAQFGNSGSLPSNQPPFEFGGQYGYYTDVETNLLCLTHRYYDPGTGKFINRDPVGCLGGMNLYGFCEGNPVNEADPSGYGDTPVDEIASLVFLTYDTGKMIYNNHHNVSAAERALDTAALVADGAGLIPGVPGGMGRGAILVHSGIALAHAMQLRRAVRATQLAYKAAQGGIMATTATGGNGSGNSQSGNSPNGGRSGKQPRLREILNDPKASSADRGWVQQELNAIARGKRRSIRVPIGKVMAYRRGMRARNGHSYLQSDLQDVDLHKLEHKHGGY